ncbi:glycosyl hydrolase [bacterium]|nr:glycosyl hydrolase [bacterium]
MKKTFFCLLCLLITFQIAYATQVGNGSYRDGGGIPEPSLNPNYKTNNLSGPVHSNDWWTSILIKQYSREIDAFPLIYKFDSSGLGVDYPGGGTYWDNANLDSVIAGYNKDFSLGFDGASVSSASVDGYSDWTVDVAMTGTGGKECKVTLLHGSPFGYATFKNCQPQLDGVTFGSTSFPHNGDKIWVKYGTNYYGFFAPSGTSWTKAGNTISVTLGGSNDYFSFAVMTSSSDLSYFYNHAYAFVSDTTVSWNYDEDSSKVETTYTLTTQLKRSGFSSTPLICLFPHQYKHSNAVTESIEYSTLRGKLELYEGASFTTELDFHGIIPYFPEPISYTGTTYSKYHLQSLVDDIEDDLASEIFTNPYGDETYWIGKRLGRCSKIIPVADQIGDTTARDYFISSLRSELANWYDYDGIETSKYFCYFPISQWGVLIGYPTGAQFHLNWLDDHHFHYGYFVYASAILAMYDSSFINDYGGMVELLIRDYNSPYRNDLMFPFLRCFDIYEGHSWANGYGGGFDDSGCDQESTSEAINSWVGMYLWGLATNNKTYRDAGVYGYVTEISSVKEYWFDEEGDVFHADYRDGGNIMASLVWGGKYEHSTWFSTEPECIHGIQWIPVTPASLYLGYNLTYAESNYDAMVIENGGDENQWHDIIWKYQSLFDPTEVVMKYDENKTADDGNTWAETYNFIQNMKSLGTVDTSVYADAPSYAVFTKSGERTYIAYNPSTTDELKVSFYDPSLLGYFVVPPNSLNASKTFDTPGEEKMIAYPNPCYLSQGYIVHFLKVPADSVIKIYNIVGELVYTSSVVKGGYAEWEGVNHKGKKIASGVYIYSIGNQAGRIAIIK